MCDTFAAAPEATRGNVMILAKNSDREVNEAQNVTFIPAGNHGSDSKVKCTYIEIPQVKHTFAAIISRPFWMFGGEMGVNERGVAIGNEAVFTKEKYNKSNNSLTGMDLLRLALERSAGAEEALRVIVELLEKYGQGGNCGYKTKLYYHNSFLIADPKEAYILETAGARWVAKKVKGCASISNCLTIEDDYELCSEGLEDYSVREGYLKNGKKLNFRRDYSDMLYTYFSKGRKRCQLSLELMMSGYGSLTSSDMMTFLRAHEAHGREQSYTPGRRHLEGLCLHGGGFISSQTTGSMTALLMKDAPPLVYFTGTAAPCLGLFKPHIILPDMKRYEKNEFSFEHDNGDIDIYGYAGGEYDKRTLWWVGEDIHRHAVMDYEKIAADWQAERDEMERNMIEVIENKIGKVKPEKLYGECAGFSQLFIEKNIAGAERIKGIYRDLGDPANAPFIFRLFRKNSNKKADYKL